MNKGILISILILLSSCEQNEIPIEQHPIGGIQTKQIEMGSDYSQQIYYKLESNLTIRNNIKTDWDLGFQSTNNGMQIIINSATFSQISELEGHLFEDPVSLIDLNPTWSWDNPKGIYNNTAFNNYQSSTTYILDRGYEINGTTRGFRKIRIDSVNNNSYFIRCSKMDNTDLFNIEIKKDSIYNFQYLSFNNDTINLVDIEPEKDSWDLLFTQYTHLFDNNEETPAYLVTGILTNYLNNVMVAKDTVNTFESININMINSYNFSNDQDKIGYDWKVYDFESQSYAIKYDINYIIKDLSGKYFKIHLTDFYNESGEKGYPEFEIQEL